jgi:DNA-binding GntR family transcriptional regulator
LLRSTFVKFALYVRSGISACGVHDHRDIIAAPTKEDGDRAAALMVEHLHHIDHDLDLTRGPSPPRALSALLEL